MENESGYEMKAVRGWRAVKLFSRLGALRGGFRDFAAPTVLRMICTDSAAASIG